MALFTLATISGVETVFTSTVTSAVGSALVSLAPYASVIFGSSLRFWTTNYGGPAITRMSYDPAEDAVLLTNGIALNPTYIYPQWAVAAYGEPVRATGAFGIPLVTLVFTAAALDPAGSAGSGGQLVVTGMTAQYFPTQGGSYGYAIDPNTNTIYQTFWHFIANGRRGGGTFLPFGYGDTPMLSVTHSTYAASTWWVAQWDGVVQGEQVIASAMLTAAGRAGRVFYAPGPYAPPLAPVVFDDVAVFVYADPPGTAWISCRSRPATGASAWRGTRSMPFGWPMMLAPMGVDRCIAVWWASPRAGAPLVYTVFRYDRALAVLRLEDVGTVPTARTYTYPQHVGYATYDRRRGHLVLLSPNPNDFDQYTPDQFCHPGVPRTLVPAVPLDPSHAGYAQR